MWVGIEVSSFKKMHNKRGYPKITRIFLILYFSEHLQNLITLKILSLRINTLIPPLFPLFKTVLELLQSDSLQCLRRFFPRLLYVLKTLSFKVPLHSWKQEKNRRMPGPGSRGGGGGGGGAKPLSCCFSWGTAAHWMLCGRQHCSDSEASHLTATIRGVLLLKFVDMTSTKLQSMLPTHRLFDDDQTLSYRDFFLMFSLVLLFEERPDRGWSSSNMSPRLNRENHS